MNKLAVSAVLLFITGTFVAALAADRGVSVKPKPGDGKERRVALVIGNSTYLVSPLKNPANDAKLMAKTLRGLGFSVDERMNLSQGQMKQAIEDFGRSIKQGGVGLFYYAGHGMQVDGRNYLIPIDADIQGEAEVEIKAVDAGAILAKMDIAKNSMNIVILDACRNNPFARSFRAANLGLASMNAPSGTLIAYATAPGSVASDGTGQNGLYTEQLATSMKKPGLKIEDVFKQVRSGVQSKTQGKQVPWESSSLVGDFYFNGWPDVPQSVMMVGYASDKAAGRKSSSILQEKQPGSINRITIPHSKLVIEKNIVTNGNVSNFALSPDGKILVTASMLDGRISIDSWNVDSGLKEQNLVTVWHKEYPEYDYFSVRLHFSPDGASVAVLAMLGRHVNRKKGVIEIPAHSVWLYSIKRKSQILSLDRLPEIVGSTHYPRVTFSPASDKLLIEYGSKERKKGSRKNIMACFDVNSGVQLWTVEGNIYDPVFSGDGARLAALIFTGDYDLQIYDAESGGKVYSEDAKSGWRLSAYDDILAIGKGYSQVDLLDMKTGRKIVSIDGLRGGGGQVVLSKDGKMAAIQLIPNLVKQYLASSNPYVNKNIPSYVAGPAKEIVLYDVGARRELRSFVSRSNWGHAAKFAFTADLAFLALEDDKGINVLNARTGDSMHILSDSALASIENMQFLGESSVLQINARVKNADFGTMKVYLWDIRTGKRVESIDGDVDFGRGVAVNTGLQTMASFRSDGVVIWSTPGLFFSALSRVVEEIEKEKDQAISALFAPKEQFETTAEYEERLEFGKMEKNKITKEYDEKIKNRKNELYGDQYSLRVSVSLEEYDADTEHFTARILNRHITIPVPRRIAVEMVKHKDNNVLHGMVRYYDDENVEMVNAFIVNDHTHDRVPFGDHIALTSR